MTIEGQIFSELTQRQPVRLLAVGNAAPSFVQAYLAAHPECERLASTEPADVAIVLLDAQPEKAACFALIGRLKQFAPVVLVVAGKESPMGFNDFLSLGMQRLLEADARGDALYLFDLHTYKPAPDWLNSKYWAHPERWKP